MRTERLTSYPRRISSIISGVNIRPLSKSRVLVTLAVPTCLWRAKRPSTRDANMNAFESFSPLEKGMLPPPLGGIILESMMSVVMMFLWPMTFGTCVQRLTSLWVMTSLPGTSWVTLLLLIVRDLSHSLPMIPTPVMTGSRLILVAGVERVWVCLIGLTWAAGFFPRINVF